MGGIEGREEVGVAVREVVDRLLPFESINDFVLSDSIDMRLNGDELISTTGLRFCGVTWECMRLGVVVLRAKGSGLSCGDSSRLRGGVVGRGGASSTFNCSVLRVMKSFTKAVDSSGV